MAPKRRPAKKIYVSVNSFFDTTGYMRPTSILWPDGRVFPIEQIRDYRPAEPSDSFFGDCYTIIIRGQEKHLFFERTGSPFSSRIGRWFVEKTACCAGEPLSEISRGDELYENLSGN